MATKLNLIAAACENLGIGKNGQLPWSLKTEMSFFTKMTSKTKDENKKNAVIMGRVTWDCIPAKFRPLVNRLNVVISRNEQLHVDEGVLLCNSIDAAVETLTGPAYKDIIERIWVIGGSYIYKASMESKYPCRIYLTHILQDFDCDTFFPKLPKDFVQISDSDVPVVIQEEKGIQFQYKVYEKRL